MKMRRVCFVMFCLFFLPIFSPVSLAQTAATGALSGTVTDPSGAVVPNVAVALTNIGTGQVRTDTTGGDGSYRIGLLAPGEYKVQFSAAGFRAADYPSVTITVTETAT